MSTNTDINTTDEFLEKGVSTEDTTCMEPNLDLDELSEEFFDSEESLNEKLKKEASAINNTEQAKNNSGFFTPSNNADLDELLNNLIFEKEDFGLLTPELSEEQRMLYKINLARLEAIRSLVLLGNKCTSVRQLDSLLDIIYMSLIFDIKG